MSFNETDVQSALKNLIDPNTQKDFVSGKSVKNIKISGSDVSLDILLGYPAKSVWDEIFGKPPKTARQRRAPPV